MTILDETQYEQVRAAIDTSLTEDDLPDATIALDLYAGAANRWLLRRDSDAATRMGDDAASVTLAAVLYCAALLVGAIPRLTQENHDGVTSYTRALETPAQIAERLLARAEDALAGVLEPSAPTTASIPTMFTRASGRRGR